jgi:hypothetical protein
MTMLLTSRPNVVFVFRDTRVGTIDNVSNVGCALSVCVLILQLR